MQGFQLVILFSIGLFSIVIVGCGEGSPASTNDPAPGDSLGNVDCTIPHAQHIYPECAENTTLPVQGNFSVVSTFPANMGQSANNPATGVSLNQTFSVSFHHDFDRVSVEGNPQAVRIMPNKQFSGVLTDPEADGDIADHNDVNNIIDATTVLSADNKTITVTPKQSLRPNTGYHLMFNVKDSLGAVASGTLYFHTILNQRLSRKEYDINGILDEQFEFKYDAQGNLTEAIKWDVSKREDGYIRLYGASIPVSQNGSTTNLQTERVEYKNTVDPGVQIPEDQRQFKFIRLRKDVSVNGNTVNALVDFGDPGDDLVWGTADDKSAFVQLPGLNHLTHLMTNYYWGALGGQLSRTNFNAWPDQGATTPVPLTTMETAFGYRQSIARQYREADRQIELRVDYRSLNGSPDPVTGIQGPFTDATGGFNPENSGEQIDDYRLYVYNPDGKLVLRIDVKNASQWSLNGLETFLYQDNTSPPSPLNNQMISAIDDYRVYKYLANGQLDRYIEYEQDNKNGNAISLTSDDITKFKTVPGYENQYVTDDLIEEEEVYTYDPNTGGLVERIEYHGAASMGIKADVDVYDATR